MTIILIQVSILQLMPIPGGLDRGGSGKMSSIRDTLQNLDDSGVQGMIDASLGKDFGQYPQIVKIGQEILSEREAFIQRKTDEDLQEWKYNNKVGHGGRPPRQAIIFLNDEVYEFEGKEIPGVVEIISEEFQKKGKWSATYWRCLSPQRAEIIIE